MFKRRLFEKEMQADPYTRKDEASPAALSERASLLQRTLSSATVYQPQNIPSYREEPDMVIGEGVTVSGEVIFDRTLRIDGEFKGELLSEGKLFVGPMGRVNCNINLSSAVIEGQVTGNVTISGSLEILGSAKVYGDITAGSLTVGPGVTLIGQVCVKQPVRSDLEEGYASIANDHSTLLQK